MNALNVTWKDIQILVRDRGRVFLLFVLPLAFILAYSTAYGLVGPEINLIELPVVNLDGESRPAQDLIDRLNQGRGLLIKPYDQQEADQALTEGKIERALIIPAGFGQQVAEGRKVTLLLVSGQNANRANSRTVKTIIDGAAKDLSLEHQLLAGFRQMGDMMQTSTEGAQAFEADRIVAQAESQFERARTLPLVSVEPQVSETLLRGRAEISAMDVAVPGFTVLFVFLTAGATATSIFVEKKLGTFRRLLSSPIAKSELLAGKMVPNLLTVLLQIVVIFAVGLLVLPLMGLERMSLGRDPVALVAVSLLVALCSTSLGVLIAGLARTEGQIGGLATVTLWVMGAVAGAFIPQFFLGEFLGTVGKAVPQYWAILAFTNVMVRGQSLSQVLPQLGVLAAFTTAFFAIGIWRFEFDA